MAGAPDDSEVLAWASERVGRPVGRSELDQIIAEQLVKDNPHIQTQRDAIRRYAENAGGMVLSVLRLKNPDAWGLPQPAATYRMCADELGISEGEVRSICIEMQGAIAPQWPVSPQPLVLPDAIKRYLDKHHPGWR